MVTLFTSILKILVERPRDKNLEQCNERIQVKNRDEKKPV